MAKSSDQFTIRLATVADAEVIATHRARMFQEMRGDSAPTPSWSGENIEHDTVTAFRDF